MSETDAFRWIASDKSSRIPLSTFRTALELHGVEVDADEVECMVANMISRVSSTDQPAVGDKARSSLEHWLIVQGFMKGYISHEKQMVVLAKTVRSLCRGHDLGVSDVSRAMRAGCPHNEISHCTDLALRIVDLFFDAVPL
jgi:hypothetical protein